jgi:hypothetical protein
MFGFFSWTNTEVLSLRWSRGSLGYTNDVSVDGTLRMKSFNLQLVELDKELFDELIENIVAFTHKLCGLLLSHLTRLVNLRLLKVRENKNEHFLGIS